MFFLITVRLLCSRAAHIGEILPFFQMRSGTTPAGRAKKVPKCLSSISLGLEPVLCVRRFAYVYSMKNSLCKGLRGLRSNVSWPADFIAPSPPAAESEACHIVFGTPADFKGLRLAQSPAVLCISLLIPTYCFTSSS